MNKQYLAPVNKLFTIGDCRNLKEWPNYLEMGISLDNVAELIEIALDKELFYSEPERLEIWAPIHAWRTLGLLQAKEAIKPLTKLFEDFEDTDWSSEELPEIYAMIGKDAIPVLSEYLADDRHDKYPRTTSAHCLKCIGTKDPDARNDCLLALSKQLEKFEENDEGLNGFLIAYLLDLKAVEALPIMEQAYAANSVDCFICGDFEDVEIALGLKKERQEKRTYKTPFSDLLQSETLNKVLASSKSSPQNTARLNAKTKNRKNMQKNSRKKNKKRK